MKRQEAKTFVPRADRRPVSLRGFALGEARDSDILVADLSYSGCGIRCDDKFQNGEIVELRVVKRGAIQAEIRWTGEGRAGVQFLN
jgi:hypothetical protein